MAYIYIVLYRSIYIHLCNPFLVEKLVQRMLFLPMQNRLSNIDGIKKINLLGIVEFRSSL